MHSGIVSPQGVWWKPAGKQEMFWVTVAFIWCLVLSAMMPLWHLKGGQNPSGIRGRVDPAAYFERVNRFVSEYKVGEENGVPVVEPPPGAEVYLLAQMWRWYPILKLKKGATYTMHLSSVDLNHGFNLHPININFQVLPGYDYGLKMTPNEAGEVFIICNEFCGIGHHTMVGKIIVTDGPGTAAVEREGTYE